MKKILALSFLTLAASVQSFAASPEEVTDDSGDMTQILKIGNKRDSSKIPLLRRIKAREKLTKNSPSAAAQMALAKLGEKTEMDEIIAESKSDAPDVQTDAIEKLRYVGNKAAIRELVRLLDHPAKYRRKEWRGPSGELHRGHVIFGPPSYQAMKALGEAVPNPPEFNKAAPSKEDIKKWREWWKNNKRKYE